MTFDDRVEAYIARIEAVLDHYLPAETVAPSILHRAMRYSALSGGKRIRPLLRGDVQKKFLQVPFVKDGAHLVAALTDEHLTQPNGWYIGIKTKMDATKLVALVEDQDRFKVMPKSMIKLNIFGMKMGWERVPPMELPGAVDLHYFKMDLAASQKMWERASGEKAMAIRWSELEPVDYQDISMYMTVP